MGLVQAGRQPTWVSPGKPGTYSRNICERSLNGSAALLPKGRSRPSRFSFPPPLLELIEES